MLLLIWYYAMDQFTCNVLSFVKLSNNIVIVYRLLHQSISKFQ